MRPPFVFRAAPGFAAMLAGRGLKRPCPAAVAHAILKRPHPPADGSADGSPEEGSLKSAPEAGSRSRPLALEDAPLTLNDFKEYLPRCIQPAPNAAQIAALWSSMGKRTAARGCRSALLPPPAPVIHQSLNDYKERLRDSVQPAPKAMQIAALQTLEQKRAAPFSVGHGPWKTNGGAGVADPRKIKT